MATRSAVKPKLPADAVVAAVLADRHIEGVLYRAGQVVRMEADKAAPYIADGTLDPASEAVAYRKAQGAEVLEHAAPAEQEPEADKAADAT